LLAATAATILIAIPALRWLAAEPSFGRMLTVLLALSALYGLYNGAMVVALTEIMPAEVRVVGFSLAYSLATALFGGFTPVISTWLIDRTHDKAAPAYWLTVAAFAGLGATLVAFWRRPVS
jgi:MHS family citrate/tricarballylate:H+ symporter-like MFS transporter